MISASTQSLLQFMSWFAVASLIGGMSYGFVKLIRKIFPNSSGEVLCVVVGFPHFGLLAFGWMFYGPIMILGALICSGSALAERAFNRDNRDYGFYYSTVLTSTALSCNLSLVPVFLGTSGDGWNIVAFLLGIISGSSAIPIIFWMLQISQVRPGIDRHLKEGEDQQ